MKRTYDAAGNKLQELISSEEETQTTDYITNVVYRNDTLQYMLTGQRRTTISPEDNSSNEEFFVKDHLGNIRSIIDAKEYNLWKLNLVKWKLKLSLRKHYLVKWKSKLSLWKLYLVKWKLKLSLRKHYLVKWKLKLGLRKHYLVKWKLKLSLRKVYLVRRKLHFSLWKVHLVRWKFYLVKRTLSNPIKIQLKCTDIRQTQ